MEKIKIYKFLRIILIIIALVLLFFVAKKFYNSYKTEKLAEETISEIVEQTATQGTIERIDLKMR